MERRWGLERGLRFETVPIRHLERFIMLKVGDVVRIKGTKVKMTVNHIGTLLVETVWFDENYNLFKYSFSKDALEIADDYEKTRNI